MDSMSRSSLVSSPHKEGTIADYDDDDQSPEESSWTMYFEDFSNNNNTDMNENSCSFSDINYQTSSLVSDAACSAARRHGVGGSSEKSCNRLSCKKRKTKGAGGLVGNDLEDTASSPANSPKVCNLLNHFDKNLQKQKHALDISHEKGNASGQTDERNDDELSCIGRENDDNELKKRGLCLVPLSMLVHYLG